MLPFVSEPPTSGATMTPKQASGTQSHPREALVEKPSPTDAEQEGLDDVTKAAIETYRTLWHMSPPAGLSNVGSRKRAPLEKPHTPSRNKKKRKASYVPTDTPLHRRARRAEPEIRTD